MINSEFIEDVKILKKKHPHYIVLWNRVLKKLENGDRDGAMKTLRSSFSIAMCGGRPDIKNDIWKVIRDEQRR